MVLKRQPFDGMYWVVRHEMGCLEHPSQLPCLGDLSWKPVDLLVQCQCDSCHVHIVQCTHCVISEQYCFLPLCLIVLIVWIYNCVMCQKTIYCNKAWMALIGILWTCYRNKIWSKAIYRIYQNIIDQNQERSKRGESGVFMKVFKKYCDNLCLHKYIWVLIEVT